MEYIYAALLLHKNGKEVSEENLKSVVAATGTEVDNSKVKSLVASLKGVDIEKELESLNRNGRLRKLLNILENFTSNEEKISKENIPNLITALLNILDNLSPKESNSGLFDIGADMEAMRIIYQLLKRYEDDKRSGYWRS